MAAVQQQTTREFREKNGLVNHILRSISHLPSLEAFGVIGELGIFNSGIAGLGFFGEVDELLFFLA